MSWLVKLMALVCINLSFYIIGIIDRTEDLKGCKYAKKRVYYSFPALVVVVLLTVFLLLWTD